MRRWVGLVALTCLIHVATAVTLAAEPKLVNDGFEMRCGWFSNPTPGNVFLFDRHAAWTIELQGTYQLAQSWDWPDFAPHQWVETNVHSGYGCACLELRVDRKTKQALEVRDARARSLAVCQQDRALRKRWKKFP